MKIVSLFAGRASSHKAAQEDFEREVAARFGLVPNFFSLRSGCTFRGPRIVEIREIRLFRTPRSQRS